MLSDKLRLFHELVNGAVAEHGLSPKHVADAIIDQAFPETSVAADKEGADAMLRDGVISYLKQFFKRVPPLDQGQLELGIPEPFLPIVSKLKGEAHYVEGLERLVSVAELISNPLWLDDARKFKRRKGLETMAEADVLDELYNAVMAAGSAVE